MADLDRLAPEQRAVLQLVLAQGKSYVEIADLLDLDTDAVRERAHGALDALGPVGGRRLTPARREEVSDYLLGQDDDMDRRATREFLADSAGARAWARVVAAELKPMNPDALPPIPAEGSGSAVAAANGGEHTAPAPAAGIPASRPRGSKLGGAILLGAFAAALIVGALFLFGVLGGDDGGKKSSTSTAGQDAGAAPKTIAQVNLLPAAGGPKDAAGVAQVLESGDQRAMVIAGQGIGTGTYAVWLYSSKSRSKLLGFVPNKVAANGRFAARAPYPDDAKDFRELVVAREDIPKNANDLPKEPGEIVLRGRLADVPK